MLSKLVAVGIKVVPSGGCPPFPDSAVAVAVGTAASVPPVAAPEAAAPDAVAAADLFLCFLFFCPVPALPEAAAAAAPDAVAVADTPSVAVGVKVEKVVAAAALSLLFLCFLFLCLVPALPEAAAAAAPDAADTPSVAVGVKVEKVADAAAPLLFLCFLFLCPVVLLVPALPSSKVPTRFPRPLATAACRSLRSSGRAIGVADVVRARLPRKAKRKVRACIVGESKNYGMG
jgi:hypothetical protein